MLLIRNTALSTTASAARPWYARPWSGCGDLAAVGAIDRLYVMGAGSAAARRHGHQMLLLEELQARGVAVVFANRPLGTTPEDQLLVQVQGVIAEYEHAKILERDPTRRRRHAARWRAASPRCPRPYGYRQHGQAHRWRRDALRK